MRPRFNYSDLKELPVTKKVFDKWEKEKGINKEWLTPEMIPIRSVYTR